MALTVTGTVEAWGEQISGRVTASVEYGRDWDDDGYDDLLLGGDDCDDADATINPAAAEVWYDGVDQDCDGNDDDQDEDGWALADDCDDEDPDVAEGLADRYGIEPERREEFFRAVDRLDKVGPERVVEELRGLGLGEEEARETEDVSKRVKGYPRGPGYLSGHPQGFSVEEPFPGHYSEKHRPQQGHEGDDHPSGPGGKFGHEYFHLHMPAGQKGLRPYQGYGHHLS